VHIRRAVTTALRLRSVDVLTAQEDRAAETDDDALLQRATDLGRVLVSQDADLLREAASRLAEHRTFSGLVYTHQLRITIGQMVDELELIAKATSAEEWKGRIEYLPLGQPRTGH
jgi:predicted nuclease of predicted toxin-antitoxin system